MRLDKPLDLLQGINILAMAAAISLSSWPQTAECLPLHREVQSIASDSGKGDKSAVVIYLGRPMLLPKEVEKDSRITVDFHQDRSSNLLNRLLGPLLTILSQNSPKVLTNPAGVINSGTSSIARVSYQQRKISQQTTQTSSHAAKEDESEAGYDLPDLLYKMGNKCNPDVQLDCKSRKHRTQEQSISDIFTSIQQTMKTFFRNIFSFPKPSDPVLGEFDPRNNFMWESAIFDTPPNRNSKLKSTSTPNHTQTHADHKTAGDSMTSNKSPKIKKEPKLGSAQTDTASSNITATSDETVAKQRNNKTASEDGHPTYNATQIKWKKSA